MKKSLDHKSWISCRCLSLTAMFSKWMALITLYWFSSLLLYHLEITKWYDFMWLLHEELVMLWTPMAKTNILASNFRWNRSLTREWGSRNSVLLQSAHISSKPWKDGRTLQLKPLVFLNKKETRSSRWRNWHRYLHLLFY